MALINHFNAYEHEYRFNEERVVEASERLGVRLEVRRFQYKVGPKNLPCGGNVRVLLHEGHIAYTLFFYYQPEVRSFLVATHGAHNLHRVEIEESTTLADVIEQSIPVFKTYILSNTVDEFAKKVFQPPFTQPIDVILDEIIPHRNLAKLKFTSKSHSYEYKAVLKILPSTTGRLGFRLRVGSPSGVKTFEGDIESIVVRCRKHFIGITRWR